MLSNTERVEVLNQRFKAITDQYFTNVNSGILYAEKVGDNYKIPVVSTEKVVINLLGSQASLIGFTELSQTLIPTASVKPFVRIPVSMELVKEWYESSDYFKVSVSQIIVEVQKAWEKQFGSYKNSRWGSAFMTCKGFKTPLPTDDSTFLDFYGDWSTNKGVE